MINKNFPSFIFCLVLLLTLQNKVKGQYILKEADQQYALYNYSRAIDLYERAYQKKVTLHAAERLAECYKYQQNYIQAENWSALAVAMADSKPINILHYARALQSNAKYAEAKLQYNKYSEQDKGVTEKQKNIWLQSCDSAIRWMKEPTTITLKNEEALNSSKSDWGATKLAGNMVFASDRDIINKRRGVGNRSFLKFDGSKMPDKNTYSWTGNPYLSLYMQEGTEGIKLFPLNAGTAYHVGPASFTADGKLVYFTLTKIDKDVIYEKVEGIKNKVATANIEIYSSTKNDGGEWSVPISFKYNNAKKYSVGDPYISPDGKHLYFVSNMPGGKGGTDLYVSEKNGSEWGQPVNLKEINTEGDERSPAFDEASNFYFSTDGRIGMGGLDVYTAKFADGKIGEPKNLGYPTNSPQDDFAFNLLTKETGYLSSNRTGGLGLDDIYSFTLPEPKKVSYTDPVVLNKEIRIENIYYDFDKWNIRPDAAIELNKLVEVLKENPTIWIVLGSHTDSRGNDAYNQALSQNRANSAVEYIIKRGIDKSRITAKGYGETRLLNRCGNGVKCTIEEHQLNRRTEFTIVKQ
ncbi:OmpA family protein [Pedobacter nyackensis]|uniref:WD40-like Beta Propeller Repeat n=1 Tax=Pedobacter nyackensis TaxID=475255 RepID=A0A1W2C748_9SPHI|nr:OmpA family protein [Pedobacter nyackensis]SMC80844.1 WD40-like Beta Propeller Repeat [Pedobacter nyackensis]